MMRAPFARRSDDGSSLLIVLIIVSVVSLVMSVILAQADTSVRSTVQLRDQASNDYSADGATNAALAALKNSTLNCSDPTKLNGLAFGSTATPFYSPVSSEQGAINAYVQCTPDAITGASTSPSVTATVSTVTPAPVTSTGVALGAGDPTLPNYAVLTTGTAASDTGFDITDSANNKIMCVENGSVASNTDINASGEKLAVRLSGTGTPGGDCTTGSGVDSSTGSKVIVTAHGTCSGTFIPTSCTSGAATVATPAAPALPSGTVAVNPAPVCDSGKKYAAFSPGLYTNVSLLNTPCSGSTPTTEWFSPGTYYFNYGSSTWNWPGTLIAGTPLDGSGSKISGLNPSASGTLTKLSNLGSSPGACDDPANSTSASGVEMVFAGSSYATSNHSGVAEICATYSSSSPPVAVYGLASSQSISTSGGSVTLPAETLCSSTCGSSSLIATDSSGLTQLYIKGYTYAPSAQMILKVKNTVGQVFNWGVVTRDLAITINGASPTQAVIHLPKANTGVGVKVTTSTPAPYPSTSYSTTNVPIYSIRYVKVWICTVSTLSAAQPTCPTTGNPDVVARVYTDASGKPIRVLSWTHVS